MQKVIPLGSVTAREATASTTSRVLRFPDTLDRTNRTFMCAVVFVDLVEYSKKPVAEQLQVKERLNAHISDAIRDIAASDRIILDTGDGVAINFLGDPEDALFVAMNLAHSFAQPTDAEPIIEARIGINLGPVRLVRDINSQPNIIGDGINVAQRVMSFAQRGQVFVSRSYYEVVTRISADYARLFAYQGSHTDKHVREHEIYEAMPNSEAHDLTMRRKQARPDRSASESARAVASGGVFARRRLAFVVTSFSIFLLAAAALYFATSRRAPEPEMLATPGPVADHVRAPTLAGSVGMPQPEAAPAPPVTVPEPAASPVQPEPAAQEMPRRTGHKAGQAETGRRTVSGSSGTTAPETSRAQDPAPPTPEPQADVPELTKPVLAPISPTPAPTHTHRAPTGPTAVVLLAISPWGEVFVDGKSVGVSPPLPELELSVGRHRIEVRNGGFKPYQEDIELVSNQTTKLKHKFTEGR